MDIPDEAVEAAAEVILSGTDAGYHAYKIAFAALEAAAPHMLAAAWEHAYQRGYCDCAVGSASDRPNPYRSQA